MKIGVSSYSFSAYRQKTHADDFTLCRLAKEMGFDGMEWTDLDPQYTGCTTEEEAADRIRAHCQALSLPLFAYAVSADFQRENVEEEIARVCRKVDVAHRLGVPLLRHDATFALREGNTWENGIAQMAPAIARVAAYAEGYGIRTCTENHGYMYQDPERVKALIEEVGHPNFGWLFDMGNFAVCDRTAAEALPMALPHLFHVHAKDMLIRPKSEEKPQGFYESRGGNHWRGTVLGRGQIAVADTVRALKAAGYDGTVTLEFEGSEDNLPALAEGLAYLKSLL